MARITTKNRSDLPPELHPLWDKMKTYGPFEGQSGVMAQRLPVFEHVWRLLTQLSDEAVLPKRYLELAIVTTSHLNECEYCVAQHTPKLMIQGISSEGVARLLDYKDHPELDEVDRLVVEYAIAVTNNWSRTRDEIFTRLRAHFTEPQIVELTWRTALCGAFNRFNDILQVDDDANLAAIAAE
ncbi:carboxymuconolactone decarboxylase family protein [Bradyrhizobium sp.]|uniref:carboxymuconolactone decarboxylase family protein n=1 Tax=Bradyrhizobium sp. TaxID=376 RepID=UPI0039E4F1BD